MIQWLEGDCRDVLQTLPAQSVHCVVTSPPYWGLREYGNGTKGIGLEATFAEYLTNLADVFAAVWRVLRDDGTLWVNMGDAYNANGRNGHGIRIGMKQGTNRASANGSDNSRPTVLHFKPKDLIGQPWRLAFALQDAGWYLRSDIIWHKPNPMPESAQDRPTKSHEYVFLLTKQPRYFYDAEAIREPHEALRAVSSANINKTDYIAGHNQGFHGHGMATTHRNYHPTGRNKRTVWTIPTQPYSAAHFATFPQVLARTCILAGTSLHGCCAACGAPWKRVMEKHDTGKTQRTGQGWNLGEGGHGTIHPNGRQSETQTNPVYAQVTTGWQPTCTCNAAVIPCTVLDPFGGAGTTALEADRQGRHAISIELNPDYSQLGQDRVSSEAPLFHV